MRVSSSLRGSDAVSEYEHTNTSRYLLQMDVNFTYTHVQKQEVCDKGSP